ncbi:type II toxin-antitoxin system VapC family toxin [Desulfofundulus thermocisternus]|jgi:PIN domain nuclease of toxin-antitoxin system|uniref:type II toxin-antitoxin system VapC family toxin n=1 Tax=Desulfofundulus thermocisternus TaxID=42471 RepID=UPI0004841AFA|nr:type II toxin-antitoxin system VapC family toxin [Desulfofundulus thermocisternus]
MRALLDTHVFLWWITDDPQLSPRARKIISSGENKLYLSAASGWEMAIKARLGKLSLPDNPEPFILEQLAVNAIEPLAVSMRHALHVYTLPDFHRDPFDRLLIAQAQLENLPIITADPKIASYPVEVIW